MFEIKWRHSLKYRKQIRLVKSNAEYQKHFFSVKWDLFKSKHIHYMLIMDSGQNGKLFLKILFSHSKSRP